MYRIVRLAPIRAAATLARTAASPRVGPMVRCSMTSTGTGRAPARIRRARSLASASLNWPVMTVSPPVMPWPHRTSVPTCGLEMTSRSSTMATRLLGSPSGAHAASPVSVAHWPPPAPRKSICTLHRAPMSVSSAARADPTASPATAGGPSRSGSPLSPWNPSPGPPCCSSVGLLPTPSTGRNSSCAVRPITSTAPSGSATPGSLTMIRRPPERCNDGSATPRASTLRRSTSNVRDMTSPSTLILSVSRACRTIWVPPCRSNPSRTGLVSVSAAAPTTATRTARARHRERLDIGASLPALPARSRRRSNDGELELGRGATADRRPPDRRDRHRRARGNLPGGD